VYVTDKADNRVRRIGASDGHILTIAGTGRAVNDGDGGPAASASIAAPDDIAIAPNGDLVVAGGGRVRRITQPVGNLIYVNDVSVPEPSAGGATLLVTLSLLAPSPTSISVNWATADGTAVAPADYQAASGTVTFPANQVFQTFPVSVSSDTRDEDDETIALRLSNATGSGRLADFEGTMTVRDDPTDPQPSVAIAGPTSVTEGNSGTTNATYTVTLSAASGRAVAVNVQTGVVSATVPDDFYAAAATLTFAPGQTSRTLSAKVVGDTIDEPNETFTVTATGAVNATVPAGTAVTTTITDDDP
jgi:hypothetical protein